MYNFVFKLLHQLNLPEFDFHVVLYFVEYFKEVKVCNDIYNKSPSYYTFFLSVNTRTIQPTPPTAYACKEE